MARPARGGCPILSRLGKMQTTSLCSASGWKWRESRYAEPEQKDTLEGQQAQIHAARDRKLEEA